jgi:hypothetical protein
LVDLFGRKRYEDRITELESSLSKLSAERDELARSLQNRDDKIKKLSSAYQEAQLALKEADKKASIFEAEPLREEMENMPDLDGKVSGEKLRPIEMKALLKRLAMIRSPEDDLLTASIDGPSGLPKEAELLARSVRSDRGMYLLHCPKIFTLILVPPIPMNISPPSIGAAFKLDPLVDVFETPVLVVSAHAGDTLIGLALNKDGFVITEAVESQVKEKHSKGGWSQRRFERLREEEISRHAEAVVQRLSEISERYRAMAKYAIVGGESALLKMISPSIMLPIVERRLERHDEKRPEKLIDDVYGFTCYRR